MIKQRNYYGLSLDVLDGLDFERISKLIFLIEGKEYNVVSRMFGSIETVRNFLSDNQFKFYVYGLDWSEEIDTESNWSRKTYFLRYVKKLR